jgi:molecular chaperone GrpE
MTSQSKWTEADGVDPVGGGPPTPPIDDEIGQTEPSALDDGRLLRAMADLDNLRKRFEREVAREREAERSRAAAEWVPVVDDLDRALDHATADDSAPASFTEGLRAVRDHAVAVLARLGFPRFEDLGERFDPSRHEAVGAIEADAPAGTVVGVVRPGYGTPETVLRPAAVVVARP